MLGSAWKGGDDEYTACAAWSYIVHVPVPVYCTE